MDSLREIEELGGEPLEGSGVEDEAVQDEIAAEPAVLSVCTFGDARGPRA